MQTPLELIPGPSGWVMATTAVGTNVGRCFVRFEPVGKRWQWTGVFIPATSVDTPPSQRRVELAVNANPAVSEALTKRLEEPIGPAGTVEFFVAFNGRPIPAEPIKLKRPSGKRLDDSWYEAVAKAYETALARGENPRAAIAKAAGVSPDVAGRWIYEARKPERGFLPPTEPGKVSV